ncbi:hypothetical protein Egran_00039, partial [Elaphomyces granulatus]
FEPEVYSGEHLGEYLSKKVIFFLGCNQSHHLESPDSIQDFLETICPAFNLEYIKGFAARCEEFDSSVGFSVADSFIRELAFNTWIGDICKAIALNCFNNMVPDTKPSRILQLDGPIDDPQLCQAGVQDGGPFRQVTLVGPDLLTAWNRLPFTRNLEQECPQTRSWTPSDHGGLYVYHGTSVHLNKPGFIEALTTRPFNGLRGSAQPNQISQGTFPIVWTTFSPLRAFLWAAFSAEVIRPIPQPYTRQMLTKPWQAGAREYYGVVVLQFSSVQPSPPECTSFTIPRGREDQWERIAKITASTTAPPTALWERFATIHGQDKGAKWPELVHGLELSLVRQHLAGFIKQFWRTVWFDNGIDALNSRHRQSLAIHYVLRPDAPAPPAQPTPPNSGGGKKEGTLRHRISRFLPKLEGRKK